MDLELLRKGFEALKIDGASCEKSFVEYFHLLKKWNRVYNLTAIADEKEIVIKHFLDSLSIAPYLMGKRIIDMGTGAGFPGIPLAIVEPQRKFVLLDSQIKKIHFLEAVKSALGLSQIEIVHARIEDFSSKEAFDTVISRAFGSLVSIKEKTKQLIALGGRILIMKGQYPTNELKDLEGDVQVIPLHVPFLFQERHLVCITKSV